MRNLFYPEDNGEPWKIIINQILVLQRSLEVALKGNCRKSDCRSGDTGRTWGWGHTKEFGQWWQNRNFTFSEPPHSSPLLPSNLPCHLLQAWLLSHLASFPMTPFLFSPPGLCFPSHFSCFRILSELSLRTQATALTAAASFYLRVVPAHQHPTGDRPWGTKLAEAPRPRYGCGSRQETAEALPKTTASLGFLLAGETLSCTEAAGPPLSCLCPVIAPEPQIQESWIWEI